MTDSDCVSASGFDHQLAARRSREGKRRRRTALDRDAHEHGDEGFDDLVRRPQPRVVGRVLALDGENDEVDDAGHQLARAVGEDARARPRGRNEERGEAVERDGRHLRDDPESAGR